MGAYHLRLAALAAATLGLSACGYNGLYSGVSIGAGNGYYGDPYYGGYGGYGGYGYGAGYGYGMSPYGWYDGFYYPGTGFYVYDSYRRPHRWSDRHRRYWTQRREQSLATGFRRIATNWSEFDRSGATTQRVRSSVTQPVQVDRTIQRSVWTDRVRSERSAARAQRSTAREQRRSEGRTERASRSNGRNRDNSRDR